MLESAPVMLMPLMLIADEPLLVSVTDLPPPVLPTVTWYHESEVGDTVTLVVPVPVPERATESGVDPAVMVQAAV